MGSSQFLLSAFGMMANPIFRLNNDVFHGNNLYSMILMLGILSLSLPLPFYLIYKQRRPAEESFKFGKEKKSSYSN